MPWNLSARLPHALEPMLECCPMPWNLSARLPHAWEPMLEVAPCLGTYLLSLGFVQRMLFHHMSFTYHRVLRVSHSKKHPKNITTLLNWTQLPILFFSPFFIEIQRFFPDFFKFF